MPHTIPPRAALRALAGTAALVALTTPVVAAAQFAGVLPAPPRRPPPLPPDAVQGSLPGGGATARDSAQARQRLDIQAWVDSAAGVLARTPATQPTPRVPPPSEPDRARTPAPVARPPEVGGP